MDDSYHRAVDVARTHLMSLPLEARHIWIDAAYSTWLRTRFEPSPNEDTSALRAAVERDFQPDPN